MVGKLIINQMESVTTTRRSLIRQVVRDMVTAFKTLSPGNFILPDDITGEMMYESFDRISFQVEMNCIEDFTVEDFEIDGGFYVEEDTLELDVRYNPDVFPKKLYDLVSELNDVFTHELQHYIQERNGMRLKTDVVDPLKYYSQPHEIDAQIAGFSRVSKITKKPFESVVRKWFEKNNENNQLTPKEIEIIINKVISTYNERFSN